MHGAGRKHFDALDGAFDAAAHSAVDAVGEAQDGDGEGDIGLDRLPQTSAVEGSPLSNRRRTRLRDSASIGKASSASKAAVSLRPWPSL